MCDCTYAKQNTQREVQSVQNRPPKPDSRASSSKPTSLGIRERKIVPSGSELSRESISEYRTKLRERIKQTKQGNRRLIRPEVNGFIKVQHSQYVGD